MSKPEPTRLHVIWMLRDARGLSGGDLNFLFVIESRRRSTASKATLKDDMGGISENTFQRRKQSLIEKNLVHHEYRDYETTIFEVNEQALAPFVPYEKMKKYVPADVLATYPSPKMKEGAPPKLGRGDTNFEEEGSPNIGEGTPPF